MLGLGLNLTSITAALLDFVRSGLKMWLPFENSEILGEDLTEGYEFTSGWSAIDGNAVINDADTFTTSTVDDKGIYKSYVTVGKTYRLTIAGTTASSTGIKITDTSAGTIYYENSSSGSFSDTVNFTVVGNTEIYIRNKSTGETTITTLKVEEVTQIAQDKSTNNSNSATLYTGKALSFDGAGHYVDIDDFTMTGTTMTMAFWSSIDSNGGYIFHKAAGSGSQFIVRYDDGDKIRIYDGATYHNFTTAADEGYKRYVIVYTPSELKLYVNGAQVGSTVSNPADLSIASTSNTKIGSNSSASTQFFEGKLSDLQIYDTAWTQADVTFDYDNPQHLVTDNSASSIALSNLKGYWHLSEGAGSFAYNSAVALGSELVTNGSFASDSDWDKGTGWTISGGTANCNNTSGSTQDLETTNRLLNLGGKNVKITFTVSNYSGSASMSVTLEGTGGTDFTGINANGTYSKVVTLGPTENSVDLFFKAANGWVGSVADVSIKEVSVGGINGATASLRQATIPQLVLMDWSKPTLGSDEITLISDPNDQSKDILGNDVRLREHSLNLDGSGYAEVADDDSLDFGTVPFTIQFWAKPSSIASNMRMVTKGVSSNGDWMISFSGTDNVRVYAKDSNGNELDTLSNFATLSINTWAMVTVIIDTPNDKILFYKDNQSTATEKTGASWSGTFNNTRVLRVGDHASGSTRFDGLIDDVRIYNRALSSDEVKQNYNAGLSQHKPGSAFSDDFSSDYGL